MNDAPLAMPDRPFAITWRPISELKPYGKNPRRHSKAQLRQLAKSMREFGLNVPVLVDVNDEVIVGHGRIDAAKSIGYSRIPTIRLEHLTAAQVKAFRIADNRLSDMSSWDEQLLGEQLKELTLVGLNFDVEATGFSMAEIDLLIEGVAPAEPDKADQLPPLSSQAAVTKPGDIWILRHHRIACGNSLEQGTYEALMEDRLASLVFTDPPYNVAMQGHAGGMGAIKHREFAMASGEMSEPEFTSFLRRALGCMARCSRGGAIHFVCMDWRHTHELLAAGRDVYSELKNLVVWAKDHGGMGSLYRSQHELIFVFKCGEGPHRNNVMLGAFGRNRTNVWRYASPSAFGRTSEEGRLLELHPTVKPVALVADAILDCSARGDIVLDPFLGSGTTVIAAERVGRICHGIEIDPLYVDTAVRRWQAYTGERARHADGHLFDDVVQE